MSNNCGTLFSADIRCIIHGAIIHDNHFIKTVHVQQLFQKGPKRCTFVLGRDNNRYHGQGISLFHLHAFVFHYWLAHSALLKSISDRTVSRNASIFRISRLDSGVSKPRLITISFASADNRNASTYLPSVAREAAMDIRYSGSSLTARSILTGCFVYSG